MMTNKTIMLTHVSIYLLLCLASCENEKPLSRDEIVRNNVEEYLTSTMNDPESYEFVELKLFDSVLYKDNINYRKNHFQQNIDNDSGNLEFQLKYKTSMFNQKEVDKLNASIKRNREILADFDSIETTLGERINEVASYTYLFQFRENNSFGAKVLKEYILQTDQDFNVINLASDKDEVYVTPNVFPGYEDIIKKYSRF